MRYELNRQVVNLADRASFEKRQAAEKVAEHTDCRENPASAFWETLFGLLGEKRRSVTSFVLMKLDPRRRRFFKSDLENCRNWKAESRCVKSYLSHLSARDLHTLLSWVRRIIAARVDAVAYPGESDPDRRLSTFAKSFKFDNGRVDDCMLYLMLAS